MLKLEKGYNIIITFVIVKRYTYFNGKYNNENPKKII